MALVELSYPSEEWIIKQRKKNVIRVIFPQGCQMTYKLHGEKLVHISNLGKPVEIPDQVNFFKTAPPKKRAEWVFVFRTPHDLHAFIQIVENVTSPDTPISRDPPVVALPRSDSLERRNKEYVKRLGLADEEEVKQDIAEKYQETVTNKEETGDRIAAQVQKIKDKVYSQKL